MKKITFYRSENELFIFESKEECLHYDRFVPVSFDKLFLEAKNAQFALLECNVNEVGITAYLQMQEVMDLASGYGGQAFHDELWKIRFDFEGKMVAFEMKYGTYDFISSDVDVESSNAMGWCPFWLPVDVWINDGPKPIVPENESKEKFLDFVKSTLTDYFSFSYDSNKS